ncbi:dihydrolipoyllysine-residue succinyltransferase [Gluconobacter sphaericus]|uniref:Dihydrolipoyllysine-residue succinyltransferase n=1 Tax=Gluconobacter sphaericus NBRC 12467 TaxID=1307951 RepID=A0AA37WAV1_9PROT|nr:dihydrolipoyllysine-residue succinyltransferase [Gluconobacter sphaericus]MBF0886624.1 dihydrolipoyllysine-residue succinyltransferase [Gluconobacter sphaericus]MBS1086730.1 dihydrolipoyllysine-residue succinyltransferase [Gluconobacter sphaericus]MBS1100251.1 dihydrolipoyllysine-residue succinyltransferase [Gluconobacter sphaericus]QQX92098.1 dihydrolipoyllysine-residue succinyltransferase [Gluconobacter sphaericus]GBR50324.1 2-oxoglutarate dehydrogenase E2 component [Gluconobacter sphaeri
MTVEIRVPALGESLTTATVARWLKNSGDYVQHDETIVELETDKVSVEVTAPSAGRLEDCVAVGTEVEIGGLLGAVDETAEAPAAAARAPVAEAPAAPPVPEPVASLARVTPPAPEAPKPISLAPAPKLSSHEARERRVPMSRLRQTIARNLKAAQNTAAILTTFNEIDMSAAKALRAEYKDEFEKKHDGARLGFMSFFARAVVGALKDYPAINAQIEGDEIVYREFVNLGIAVGTERGLVVPVLHDADQMSFAELERRIADYGKRARTGGLKLEELSHGTFSITNGGIFGSLLSTPILNTPQSGILGMHAIQDRPVVRDGQIVIRPMMYVALSYDHRIVDGREAVSFLVRIKQLVEDPRRLLLDL